MEDIIVKVEDLKYRYEKAKSDALQIDGLDIFSDQIIGIIGANGSGKTTLMKLISCLLNYKDGAISVLGKNAKYDDEIKKRIIYSMHDVASYKNDTPKALMKYYQLAYPDFDREFAEKLFTMFEIKINRALSKMSQGQKSVVCFVCALATRATLTLLDEPFTAVDIVKRKVLYDVLLRDYMEHPRTIIVSSHNLDELEATLSQILFIDNGKVVFYEDIDDVRQMLFRADGDVKYFKDNDAVVECYDGELGHYIIAKGGTECELANQMKKLGIKISNVSPSDVCVYLTNEISKDSVEALWS